MCLL
jgi:hypothetical protein